MINSVKIVYDLLYKFEIIGETLAEEKRQTFCLQKRLITLLILMQLTKE
jgi:hypothetical protein